ncbi:MAG: cell division ATP-binding protein FtsE [Ignavibacteriaceae bacterium]|jgi:cell division transport system ATP-binding protein|nr:cell division ATP-binding protein FtsE [Ignavibacteriaceae bacterium]HPO56198.1 cell division ATP-binding protein FtsE [Ignavibacteriaceae bacterium]
MLEFKDVEVSFNNQKLFNKISFAMNHGEFIFLTGKSGCGKSSLLQMVYMNLIPQAGVIRLLNYNSGKITKRELPLLRRKLGIVFQDFRLLKDRNVYDNLAFVLETTNVKSREIKRRINHVLTEVGLTHRRKSMPAELSGGEQQRIGIARAIINEPVLVLADEPTGNLDPETSLEILDILKKINQRGTAVIFATHNYELVKSIQTRTLRIEEGQIVSLDFGGK